MRVLDSLAGDIRQAVRGLRKNRAYTFTAIATLALAIGANIAIFTLARAVIFASLPVVRSDRLMEVSLLDSRGENRLPEHSACADRRAPRHWRSR